MTTGAVRSWTPALVRRVVEAFVHGRHDAFAAILQDVGGGGPVRDAVTGLREFVLANHGRLPWTDLGPHLDAALAEPPPSSEVLVCLLNAACVRARELDRDPERRRLVARMREVLPRLRLPRTQALVHRQAWMIAMEDDDVPAALAEVAALDPGDDLDLRQEFECHAVDARLADHDVAGVRPRIDHLVACGNPLIDAWYLRARLDLVTGEPAAVMARVETDRHLPPGRARHPPSHLVAEAAALVGREDLVESLVADRLRLLVSGPSTRRQERFLASVRLYARICRAIRRRESEPARDLMRACGPLAMAHPEGRRYLLRASLRLDLSTGALASARDALVSLDPHGRRGDLQVEWARLLRAEGDGAGAAARIAAVLARGAGATLAPALAWAQELDAAATADLLLAAREPSTPATTVPPARPATPPERLVGDSPGMRAVRAAIDAVAPLDQAVLILGETGTGKEIAAGLIHAGGRRGAAPLIALNCAAIPESLAESELFGHRRGSFTGAEQDREGILSAAGDGDVFLDEIDSLSLRLQGLLLRVLETGDYRAVGDTTVRRCRARFITAANRDLGALIAEGRFRSDLYYRLQRFVVTIPPLRDRREDIPALAGYLIDRVAGDRRLSLDPRLVDLLVRHDWPGNVRELRNAVERMALLCGDRRILGPADCPELAPGWGRAAAVPPPAPPPAMPVPIPGQPRTRDRRARILALFATQPRLHRQDVVRELCTAATTATEDLRVLCALGLIRRIDTSGHACTSYFVKVGEGEDGASGHGAVRTK